MRQQQNGSVPKKQTSGGKVALIGAAGTAIAMFNMLPGGEAPSAPVLVLQYILLAAGLIGFVGGLIMMAAQK